jgi:hypothetical protein
VRKEVEEAEELLRIAEKKVIQNLKQIISWDFWPHFFSCILIHSIQVPSRMNPESSVADPDPG